MRPAHRRRSRWRIRLALLAPTFLGIVLLGGPGVSLEARADDENQARQPTPLEERAKRIEILKKVFKVDRSGSKPAATQSTQTAPEPRAPNTQLRRRIE